MLTNQAPIQDVLTLTLTQTLTLTNQAPILDVLTTLEADGESQQREIVELSKELKTLQRTIKQKDKVIEESTEQIEELKRQPHDLPALHNDIKMLLHTIEGLQEENKTLTRIQHAKTKAIEELTVQLQGRDEDEDQIVHGQNRIKSLEAREKELLAELNTLKLAEQKRTKAILKDDAVDVAVTAKEWVEERRFLKAQLKKLTEENENHVRLQKAHNTRVMTLQVSTFHVPSLCVGGHCSSEMSHELATYHPSGPRGPHHSVTERGASPAHP